MSSTIISSDQMFAREAFAYEQNRNLCEFLAEMDQAETGIQERETEKIETNLPRLQSKFAHVLAIGFGVAGFIVPIAFAPNHPSSPLLAITTVITIACISHCVAHHFLKNTQFIKNTVTHDIMTDIGLPAQRTARLDEKIRKISRKILALNQENNEDRSTVDQLEKVREFFFRVSQGYQANLLTTHRVDVE